MPRPVYIICSESGAQDASTNLLSLFQVFESLQLNEIPPEDLQSGKPVIIPIPTIHAVAVWMSQPDDPPDQEYEFQMAFLLPPNDAERIVHEGKFSFIKGKPLYRMVVRGYMPQLTSPGLFRIECRIRKVGEENWLRQDYPIPVEAVTPVKDSKREPTETGNGEAHPQQ